MDLELLNNISQIGIILFGVSSIILVSVKNKWGFVLGLLAQPFWFATAIINEQWGIFMISFVYLGSWIYGIYVWFFKDTSPKAIPAKSK